MKLIFLIDMTPESFLSNLRGSYQELICIQSLSYTD